MRLTSWNVSMSLHRKLPWLMTLNPDLAVLPEVGIVDVGQHEESCWVGNLPHKGLGALAFNGFQIRRHCSWNKRIEFVMPLEVTGPIDFQLVAVWAMHNRAIQRIEERPNRWQVLQALEAYDPLTRSKPTVVAGDFNNAVLGDRPGKGW